MVVVGGGPIAVGHIENLINAGAQVRIVSAAIGPVIEAWVAQGRVGTLRRAFRCGDLAGAAMAIVFSSERSVAEAVAAEAKSRAIPVNVVGRPDLSSFFFPEGEQQDRGIITGAVAGEPPSVCGLVSS